MTTPAPGGAAGADRRTGWQATVDALTLLGPVGLLTGLLYYFGYVSARTFYAYFGVSLSVLDFATTDYLLTTPDTLFWPVMMLLLAMLGAYVLHQGLDRLVDRRRAWVPRTVAASAIGLGVVSAAVGALGLLDVVEPLTAVVAALSLAAAAVLVEYGLWIADRHGRLAPRSRDLIGAAVKQRRGLLAGIVLVAVFWAVTDLAQQRGRGAAEVFELSLPLQAQAVVYSESALMLPGPGVGTTAISDPEDGYAFRYNGLRQLLYANERWFLLPVGWTHSNGATVVVLPDDHAGSRVDLAP